MPFKDLVREIIKICLICSFETLTTRKTNTHINQPSNEKIDHSHLHLSLIILVSLLNQISVEHDRSAEHIPYATNMLLFRFRFPSCTNMRRRLSIISGLPTGDLAQSSIISVETCAPEIYFLRFTDKSIDVLAELG